MSPLSNNLMRSKSTAFDEAPAPSWAWVGALLFLLGLFAFCWMDVIPFGDELQQFPRALNTLEPGWLSNDLFVGAPQGDHWVFFKFLAGLFWLAGPMWGAVVARVAIWVLMACSLLSLGRALNLKPLAVVLGTALFIVYDQARLGGETIVGEAIAKHLAYPLVLFALAGWIRGRFLFAAVLLGLATSVHVLVGVWASAIILGLMFFDERMKEGGWRLRLASVAVCIVCALPGLIPILPMVLEVPPSGAAEADQIFVHFRHPHHLSPASWSASDYLNFAGVFTLFTVLYDLSKTSLTLARIRQFVLALTVVTVVALVVGLVTGNPFFLKLHPYRLAPPLTALIVALILGNLVTTLRFPLIRLVGVAAVATVALWLSPRGAYHFVQNERKEPDVETSRLEALHWIKEYAAPGATVLANPAWADVQWESRHAAPVSFKLIPFEASRINEWYGRLTDVVGVPPWSVPGHLTWNWIHEAYDALSADRLISLAGRLGADFVLAPAPCTDSAATSYSNRDFCIYSTSQTAVVSHKYLVLRYDDYSPISPYVGPPRQIATEKRLFDLAAKYDATVSVGVIPFPIEDHDATPRNPATTQTTQSWLSDSNSPWVELLRGSVDRGVVEPALHGFEHRKRTPADHRPGEYRGQPHDWQRQTIRLGRDAMLNALGSPIRVFIPPWNAWDTDTVEALEELDFEWLSPDQHDASFDSDAIRIAPQCTADPAVALAAMEDSDDAPPGTVLVLVAHPFDFENDREKGEQYFRDLESVLAFAKSSPQWMSVGFTGLPDSSPKEATARFRSAVAANQSQEMFGDLFGQHSIGVGTSALYRPFHWYQDHLWHFRLPFIGVVTGAALAAALAAALLTLRISAGRLLARIGLSGVIVAVLYLGVGAWRITERGYAVRGVRWLAISVAAGAAVGLAIAAIRRGGLARQERKTRVELVADDRTNRSIITA